MQKVVGFELLVAAVVVQRVPGVQDVTTRIGRIALQQRISWTLRHSAAAMAVTSLTTMGALGANYM